MNYKNIYGRCLRSEFGGRFQPFCRTLINPCKKFGNGIHLDFFYKILH